jgi:hypothetical protein
VLPVTTLGLTLRRMACFSVLTALKGDWSAVLHRRILGAIRMTRLLMITRQRYSAPPMAGKIVLKAVFNRLKLLLFH